MLLRQHRGGGQHRHLLARRDRLEDGPDRHLGFAEAHVAAHQPVHRLGLLHIPLDIGDGLHLVGGGLVGEGVFELVLPGAVGGEGEARCLVALGVELHQIHRHLAHGLFGALLGLGPGRAAHAVEVWRRIGAGAVAAEAAQLVGGNPQ